jgi:adenosine deaminase
MNQTTADQILPHLIAIISETNGLSLQNTLELLVASKDVTPEVRAQVQDFSKHLNNFRINDSLNLNIDPLLDHPVGKAFKQFFKSFPLKYREEHIHLTGSLSKEYVFPRLKALLDGPMGKVYAEKISAVYGDKVFPLDTAEKVDHLMRLQDDEYFDRYLEILLLPKLILNSSEAHAEAAYHMASEVYHKYNVGAIRLKFTLSRATTTSKEDIPGADSLSSEEVVLGLYQGFKKFQKEYPDFEFILSPSFRKEASFFDAKNFPNKKAHFEHQVKSLLNILIKHPELAPHVTEVDTVGSEKDLYRKEQFKEMKYGFRKLQSRGIKLRSHHGETWETLRRGIQAVDNAMNIWHVDAVEHGLSLGINPNYYFHKFYQSVMVLNAQSKPVPPGCPEYRELMEMDWNNREFIREKLLNGTPLSQEEDTFFVKTKFHVARELEHYQHDILNRMIDKELSVIALPSSNKKLTGQFEDYKEHPFSWWEKKGVKLGVGTDNYITLNTNYLREMLILLFTDPVNLKITKLLMVCTGEKRRPFISQHLWNMRKKIVAKK